MNITSLAKKELLAVILLMALPGAGAPAWADPAAQTLDMAAYDQLQALAGQWRARSDAPGADGATLELMVTSNGKAVLERLFAGTPDEMTTVYYLAYDRLLATHYCSIGNQPTYRLSPASTPTSKGDAAPTHARMLLERVTPAVAGS